MKLNEVTVNDLKQYLKIDFDDDDMLLKNILDAGIQYIKDYTGAEEEYLNTKDTLSIALFVICAEMYENRVYSNPANTVRSRLISGILDTYRSNLV